MATMLKAHFGFTTAGTRLLTNEEATKQGILDRLDWLVDGTAAGDVLVLTLSSHGTWTVNRHGDENPDEELDGRDEVIVPFDYRKDHGLVDDEIAAVLDRVPEGARCYCVIDTCYSGTATRELGGGGCACGEEGCGAGLRSRFVSPPVDVQNRFSPKKGWRSRRATRDDAMNRISLSGCDDDETSLDIPTTDGNYGLLTHTLYQALEAGGWKGTVAGIYEAVKKNVVIAARAMSHRQTPQLHGPRALRRAQLFR